MSLKEVENNEQVTKFASNLQTQLELRKKVNVDGNFTQDRPMRVINQIVSGFPKNLLDQVDADTTKYLRPLIKAPMIIILYIAGV